MKRLWVLWLLVGLVACSSNGGSGEETAETRLRVLAVHDFHGALLPRAQTGSGGLQRGGAATLKAYMDREEADCACPTLRLDGGDVMQGTLLSSLAQGAPTVRVYNALGMDAAAIGNHELDWGIDAFRQRLEEADFPWLAANIFERSSGGRPDWARPWAILEEQGVRVGVVGYLTSTTPQTLPMAISAPFEFRRGYDAIADVLEEVRAAEVDFVILLSHADGQCKAGKCTGEMVEVALEMPPGSVDLVVSGHEHDPGRGVVNGVPIVRAGPNGTAFSVVDLSRNSRGDTGFDIQIIETWTDALQPDASLTALVDELNGQFEAEGSRVITTLSIPMSKDKEGDRRLGYLMADAQRHVAGTDLALQNIGGVRADLPSGPVTYSQLFDVMPFGSEVLVMQLSGREIRDLVSGYSPKAYWSNLVFDAHEQNARNPAQMRLADGRVMQDEQTYSLALSSYLANGGDGLSQLVGNQRISTGKTVLECVIEYLQLLPQPIGNN